MYRKWCRSNQLNGLCCHRNKYSINRFGAAACKHMYSTGSCELKYRRHQQQHLLCPIPLHGETMLWSSCACLINLQSPVPGKHVVGSRGMALLIQPAAVLAASIVYRGVNGGPERLVAPPPAAAMASTAGLQAAVQLSGGHWDR